MERSGVGTRFIEKHFSIFPKTIPQGGEKMKNLMAFDNSTYDGHGGRAEAHRAEMEEIARKVYAEEH